jgi:hypothetical protein
MSRKLFVIYLVVAAIYGALNALTMTSCASLSGAVGYAFVTYVISGALPFAVWGARGFKAAHAKSLFIPWAILGVLLIIAGE